MEKEINTLVKEELDILKIGTAHNKKRFIRIVSNMFKTPGKSVLSQSNTRTEAKAAYQFINNDKLKFSEVTGIHRFKTLGRIAEADKSILLIQDTTFAIYNSQKKKSGLGKKDRNTLSHYD
jgi:hypothetical protein